jgi:hypothetical protein
MPAKIARRQFQCGYFGLQQIEAVKANQSVRPASQHTTKKVLNSAVDQSGEMCQ